MRQIIKNSLLIITGLGTAGFLGFCFAGVGDVKSPVKTLPLDELKTLAGIYAQIKANYVEPVDDKQLINDAIRGMVSGLDPHSNYLDKKEFEEMQEHTQGKFTGLGLEISSEDDYIKVINPIEDTPAYKAGIQSGDLITHINGKPARGLSTDQAARRLRGTAGTQVTITILRRKEERSFPITLTRAEIKVQSVKSKEVQKDYLWVRLNSFQERSTEDLAQKLTEAYQANPKLKGMVLDLRNNGGGVLQSAIGISATFLPKGVKVTSTNGQMSDSKNEYFAKYADYRLNNKSDPLQKLPEVFKTLPMVVLINAYSASASEIVAGALKDYQRATIIGKSTFGKGSVQTIQPLPEGTALKMTTAYYYTPKGLSIQSKGVRPDFVVDQLVEGDREDPLISREYDSAKHLKNKQFSEDSEKELEEMRIQELQRLAIETDKKTPEQKEADRKKKAPEPGTPEDFMLSQAILFLQGKPIKLSQSVLENFKAGKTIPASNTSNLNNATLAAPASSVTPVTPENLMPPSSLYMPTPNTNASELKAGASNSNANSNSSSNFNNSALNNALGEEKKSATPTAIEQKLEGKLEEKLEIKPEIKPEPKVEPKSELKSELKPQSNLTPMLTPTQKTKPLLRLIQTENGVEVG